MVFAIILLVLLAFSLLGNLTQMITHALTFNRGFKSISSREVGPKLDECVLEDNGSHHKIAVITVDGIISSHSADDGGNNMVDVIKAQLDRAADDDEVKAVILKVDSPGGEVMARRRDHAARCGFSAGRGGGTRDRGAQEQAGDLLNGQSGRFGRLLHFGPLPLDRGQ